MENYLQNITGGGIKTQNKRVGARTVKFGRPIYIIGHAAVAGKKEGQGPLGDSFDIVCDDPYFAQKSWEKAESELQRQALSLAVRKSGLAERDIQCVFGGDLLNQCIGTSFNIRGFDIPFFGLYGACSTMAESLALCAAYVDGGFAEKAAAVTSSHFCTAERQYRQPLAYGAQRTPTAQWTATAAGAAVLSSGGQGPRVTMHTTGKILDMGINDTNNMGGAMAPAAYDTLSAFFTDTDTAPEDYDLILTGDLAKVGSQVLRDLFSQDGVTLGNNYNDCGLMLYDTEKQDVHAGGSGCGCSACVLTGHILNGMRGGRWSKVLFAATGALMSPISSQQGDTIPAICHAILIEA